MPLPWNMEYLFLYLCSYYSGTVRLPRPLQNMDAWEVLAYWLDQGCPWDADTCVAAAHGGHLDILRFEHYREGQLDVVYYCMGIWMC
jgi:hypothetical protein